MILVNPTKNFKKMSVSCLPLFDNLRESITIKPVKRCSGYFYLEGRGESSLSVEEKISLWGNTCHPLSPSVGCPNRYDG